MFSDWFSGDDLERYRTSPHKLRIDGVASSLLRLRHASEVIRQHLHGWLRFSLSAWRVAAPADPASFAPPSGSFSRQMKKGAFAVVLVIRLLPWRGFVRF